ncbi:MAG: glycosyltransferase [Thermodesulfobacteriota bacterium]
MRILHLETGKHLYGGAKQVYYLIKGLSSYPDVENELACPPGSAILDECREVADKCHTVTVKGDLDITFLFRFVLLLRSRSPDIVHVHSRRGADIWGALAARACGIKTVVSRRVDNPESPAIMRYKYSMYHGVIAISNAIRDELIREGIPGEKIYTVHSAVEYGEYQQECDRSWFRQEFDLEENAKAVGMIAQFISRKGHDSLIRAMPLILNESPDARFLLLGTGELFDSCQEKTRSMGLEYAVRMPGFRNDLKRILPCLQVVAHPASMEGLGVSLLQASAAGVPVVATAVGGIPEIVEHLKTGYLVPVDNSERLAKAVVNLLKNKSRAGEFASAGRKKAREKFSVEAMVKGNYRVYLEVLEDNSS